MWLRISPQNSSFFNSLGLQKLATAKRAAQHFNSKVVMHVRNHQSTHTQCLWTRAFRALSDGSPKRWQSTRISADLSQRFVSLYVLEFAFDSATGEGCRSRTRQSQNWRCSIQGSICLQWFFRIRGCKWRFWHWLWLHVGFWLAVLLPVWSIAVWLGMWGTASRCGCGSSMHLESKFKKSITFLTDKATCLGLPAWNTLIVCDCWIRCRERVIPWVFPHKISSRQAGVMSIRS